MNKWVGKAVRLGHQAAAAAVGAEGGSVGSLPLTAADDWITLWEARTPIRAGSARAGRSVAHYSFHLRQHLNHTYLTNFAATEPTCCIWQHFCSISNMNV